VAVIGAALGAMALLTLGVLASDRGNGSVAGPILVGLTDPIEDQNVFSGESGFFDREHAYFFVIDIRSGQIVGIQDLCPRDPPGRVLVSKDCWTPHAAWLDDDSLEVQVKFVDDTATDAFFKVDLSGEVRRIAEIQTKPEVEQVEPPMRLSADGAYAAMLAHSEIQREEVYVAVRGQGKDLLVNSVQEGSPRWSSTTNELAFIGNYCAERPERFDLFVLDAEQPTLKNLSEGMLESILFFRWSPTGKQIAATGFSFDQSGRNPLFLFDLSSGVPRTLVNATSGGTLIPYGWNPSGTHLLAQFYGGGDWCNGTILPAPPTSLQEIDTP
jgi:hypothetical protein